MQVLEQQERDLLMLYRSYLTQIADQLVVLISDDHCRNLVLSDSTDEDSTSLDEDESDRLFNFEVSKTNEQEENVTMVPGFKVRGVLYRSCTRH